MITVRHHPALLLLIALLSSCLCRAIASAAQLGPWQALVAVGGEIQVLDLQGGQPSPLPGGSVLGSDPRLAPSRDYFCFQRASASELWLANFSGTQRRLYQCDPGRQIGALAWWPDVHGVLIAVTGPRRSRGWSIFTITPSGRVAGAIRQVSAATALCAFPDNRTAYVNLGYEQETMLDLATGRQWPPPAPSPGIGMWLAVPRFCRTDGRIYTGLQGGSIPMSEWARYPQAAANEAKALEVTGLYSFQTNGRGLRRIPGIRGHRTAEGWRADVVLVDVSPDGKWLLFTCGAGGEKGLWLSPRAGGTATSVPGLGQTLSNASWSQ